MRITPDCLLHTFSLNAGTASSVQPLGGWEEPKPKASFVAIPSACALRAASAGDAQMKAHGDEMVAELAKCQAKLTGGYLSAYPTEAQGRWS